VFSPSLSPLLCPSILAADFGALGAAVAQVAPQTDWVHVDVMDGHFVPNLSIGAPVVKSLRKHTDLPLDCHLMITDPKTYLPDYAKAGADGCSVHVEVGNTADLIAQMRDLGLRAGIVAQPDTPFETYAPFLGDIDVVLLMTVFAGFGGQSFLADQLPKIEATAQELTRLQSSAVLQVDGGIDLVNGPRAALAGATAFVAGTAIFGHADPLAAAAALRAVLATAMSARQEAVA
jgi:ribulose-phosphate 3-epimerase